MAVRRTRFSFHFAISLACTLLRPSDASADAPACTFTTGYLQGRTDATPTRSNGFDVIDAMLHTPTKRCASEVEPGGPCAASRDYVKGYQCGYSAVKRQQAEAKAEWIAYVLSLPFRLLQFALI